MATKLRKGHYICKNKPACTTGQHRIGNTCLPSQQRTLKVKKASVESVAKLATKTVRIRKEGTLKYSMEQLEKHASHRTVAERESFESALLFAAGAHSEQTRKSSKLPYVIHPAHVACLLLKYVPDVPQEVIIAALLHDTIEDTGVTHQMVYQMFGQPAADLVQEVTKQDHRYPGISKPELKERERIRLAGISPNGQTIKLGDILSNTKSMQIEMPEKIDSYGKQQWRLFNTLVDADPRIREKAAEMFTEMGY